VSSETNNEPRDEAVDKELEGVPEELLEGGDEGEEDAEGGLDEALEALKRDLDNAKQEVPATGFSRDVLSVADNLARAIDHVPAELRDSDQAKRFIEGIEATQRELEKVFGQHGITRIASTGLPLDPNQHQAMMEVPTDEHEPGTIVQEMQPGYMIKDRLLRPAMVGVAKKPD